MITHMHYEYADKDIVSAPVRIFAFDPEQPNAERIERLDGWDDSNGCVVMRANERGVWRLEELWYEMDLCRDEILISEAHRIVNSVVQDIRADSSRLT